jgi:hypothetical protein
VEVLDAWPEVGAVFNDFRWFASGAAPEAGQLYLAKERFIERAGSFLNRRELGGHPVWVSSRDFIKFVSTDIIGIHTSSIAIRRSLIESLGSPTFREDIPHCEDIELWLRITRATQLAILETPLSFYRYRPGGWMVSNKRATLVRGSYMVKSEMLKQLEQMLSPAEWPQYRDRLSKSWFGLGYLCLVVGLVPQAREAYREALRTGTGPAHVWKAVKGLLVSVLPRPLLRAYWKARGGGEFEPRPGPPV